MNLPKPIFFFHSAHILRIPALKITGLSSGLVVAALVVGATIYVAPALGQSNGRIPTMLAQGDGAPLFEGGIKTTPGGGAPAPVLPPWDAYGQPDGGATSGPLNPPAQSLLPAEPSPTGPGGTLFTDQESTWGNAMRLLQEIRFQHTFISGTNGRGLDINDIETSVTFALPFFFNRPPFFNQTPLLVTPGIALHLWDGPESPAADMPGQTYDLYVDGTWRPHLTQNLSADLGLRVGLYSDFRHLSSDSIRFIGRGLGKYQLSERSQIVLGVIYVDRFFTKLIPAGGLIWKPTPDVEYHILFPNPRMRKRMTTVGPAEVWWYLAGEWGGGAWTIERASGVDDAVDYYDIRLLGGFEWETDRYKAHLGVGLVFDRKLKYVSGSPLSYKPFDTVMLRWGLSL